MKEEEILETRLADCKQRLRVHAHRLRHETLVATDVPGLIQKHPYASLVAGAVAGLLVSRGLTAGNGSLEGTLTGLRKGAFNAARLAVVRALLQ